MELAFTATAIERRGPAPYVFLPLPPDAAQVVHEMRRELTYGWGAIPASATTGATTWTTSMFPREGTYLLPVKVAVQRRGHRRGRRRRGVPAPQPLSVRA